MLSDLFSNPTPIDSTRTVPQILKSLLEIKLQYEAEIVEPSHVSYGVSDTDSLWDFMDSYTQRRAYEYRAFMDCGDVRRFITQSEWESVNMTTTQASA